MVVCFLVAGFYGEYTRKRVSSTPDLDHRSSHIVHVENSTQLFLITVLLAGILAVQIAALLK